MAIIKKSGGRVKTLTQQSKRFVSLPNDNTITRNMMQDNIVNSEKATVGDMVLVGEIRQMGTLPGTPTPGGHWQDLDGTVVSDADSPYNGTRLYNLNGANVVLSLDWTADVGGAYCTVAAADINALNEGDAVTGSGIAANSFITDITGNTVTISDTAASGVITSTFTNDGIYLGGGSDGSGQDQMQRMTGKIVSHAVGTGVWTRDSTDGALAATRNGTVGIQSGSTLNTSLDVEFDSADSPNARTSATTGGRTRPHTRFVKMIMRIK